MKGRWQFRKVLGLVILTGMMIFMLAPVRKLVVSFPSGNLRMVYPLPPHGRFSILYDARPEGHHATGDFFIERDGRLRLLRMIYQKPFPLGKIRNTVSPGCVTEDPSHVFVRQEIPPFPAVHLVVTAARGQTLLLEGRAVHLRDIFPEGALLDIRTVRRARLFWWWMNWTGTYLEGSRH